MESYQTFRQRAKQDPHERPDLDAASRLRVIGLTQDEVGTEEDIAEVSHDLVQSKLASLHFCAEPFYLSEESVASRSWLPTI
jgi:hypothetical protein